MQKTYILILFLINFKVSAQDFFKISGYVRDSVENITLPNASVNINYGKTGTTTDANGYYEIKVNQSDVTVSLKYIGYKPFRLQLNLTSNLILNINLSKVSTDLEEVIVTSKANANDIKRPILGVNTLSIKTLQRIPAAMGELDILRGLQMLPGVTSVGEAANGVNIRGGTTDQNLLLIDDMPIFNPTHMFGLFSAFPAEGVSSFDLYKGNVPARFGGRAAAVLDVSLSQPSLDKFNVQGGISFVANRLKFDMPLIKDKMGVMFTGRAAVNDFMLPLVSNKLDNIKAKFGDGAMKWFYKINQKHTLTLSGYYSKDFFQTQLLGTIGGVNATSTQFDYQTLSGALRWFWAINPKTNLQTTVVSSHYVPVTLLPEFRSDNKVKLSSVIDYQHFKTNINRFTEKNKIEIGINVVKYQINPGVLDPGTSQRVQAISLQKEYSYETGIYAEDEWTISPKLSISAGLRYSYFMNLGPLDVRIYAEGESKDELSLRDTISIGKGKIVADYGGFEPRIGLQYSISKQSSVKFGYNVMRQYIQIVSNTTTPLPTSRWKTSDKYIRPQVSKLFTAGVFHNFKDNIYEVSLEGYYRLTNHILDYKPGADFILNQFPETELLAGKNRSYGIEMMVSKKKGDTRGWINYTYARSFNLVSEGDFFDQQVNFGQWYPSNFDRPHSFNSTLIFSQGKHHDFSFNFTYSTGRPYSVPNGFTQYENVVYPFFDVRNNARIPDYHRLDFAWTVYQPSMKDKRWKSHWTFTVYNIYGRKNAYSVFLRTQATTVNANKLIIFGAPIASLTYNFKFM
jgi:TonB dependent receptor/CarboxypepD_reg-like domain/TonB-dependent Receptor Plug Domain